MNKQVPAHLQCYGRSIEEDEEEEDVHLPNDWTMYTDDNGKCYYFNSVTGESQWDYPVIKHANTLAITPDGLQPLQINCTMPDYMLAKPTPNHSPMSTHASSNHTNIGITNNSQYYSDVDDDVDEIDESQSFDYYHDNNNVIKFVSPRYWLKASRQKGSMSSNSSDTVALNQDYLALARTYVIHRPYSKSKTKCICVLCNKSPATDVFFPCEHRCVCRNCIGTEQICEDRMLNSLPHGCCNCPLCASIIKLILPHDLGREVETYWSWVYEIVPQLPKNFLRRWKHSADVLSKVYVTGEQERNYIGTGTGNSESDDNNCIIV